MFKSFKDFKCVLQVKLVGTYCIKDTGINSRYEAAARGIYILLSKPFK